MSIIDRFLPPKRITRPEYWYDFKDDPRIKALRAQRHLSLTILAEELAMKASELRTENPDRVIHEYRRKHGLTQEGRWKPRNQWQHLFPKETNS